MYAQPVLDLAAAGGWARRRLSPMPGGEYAGEAGRAYPLLMRNVLLVAEVRPLLVAFRV